MTALLLPALAALFCTALWATAACRPPTAIGVICGWFLTGLAALILIVEAAGLLHLLRAPVVLLLHTPLLFLAFLLWHRSGRPSLVGSLGCYVRMPSRRSLREHPALALLAAVVAFGALAGAALIVAVPPNNWDSMTYHLSRIAYWLQHQSFYPWNTHNVRQTMFPMNAELAVLWTMLFSGGDCLAGFVQWSALFAGLAAIAGLARLLGASRSQSLFAGLLWTTFPQILLQSTTTQNDLLAAACLACATYFLLAGLRLRRPPLLLLSGIGVGLAVGIKITVIFLLPGLGAVLALEAVRRGREMVRPLLAWVGSCAVSCVLLGALVYAQNLAVYEHPLGAEAFRRMESSVYKASWNTRLLHNALRYVYQAADTTGLPARWADPLHELKADLVERIGDGLADDLSSPRTIKRSTKFILRERSSTHEDYAWFGPLAFLVLLPLGLYHTAIGFRRGEIVRLALVAASLAFFLGLCLSSPWSPWRGRLFVIPVTLCAPFLATTYRPRGFAGMASLLLVLTATQVFAHTLLFNEAKPLVGDDAIWGQSRVALRTPDNTTQRILLETIADFVPERAGVGIFLKQDDWDYPLFGTGLERRVVPMCPTSPLGRSLCATPWFVTLDARDFPSESAPRYSDCAAMTMDWLRREGIEYLLLKPTNRTARLFVPPGLRVIARTGEWRLLEIDDPTGRPQPVRVSALAQSAIPPETPFFRVGSSFEGRVGFDQYDLPYWGLDQLEQGPALWLGYGKDAELQCTVWSDAARDVTVELDAVGAAQAGQTNELQLLLDSATVYTNLVRRFTQGPDFDENFVSPTRISFPLRLERGFNHLWIEAESDGPPTHLPPEVTRPLLVLLKSATLAPATQPE